MNQVASPVILITGASSGIGYETALAFARQGARVAALARRADRLAALSEAAASLPGEILPLQTDVTRPDEIRAAVEQTVARWGRLDVLVANAGIGHRGSLVEAAWDDLEIVLRTNIDGVLHSIRAAVPAMRASPGDRPRHIHLISSITGNAPPPYAAAYGASKAFVNGLARALRVELAADRIYVTTFLVGQTDTEFAQRRLGHSGKVAGKLPSMSASQVAETIARVTFRPKRTVVLRLIDRVLIAAGAIAPAPFDQFQGRIYR